MSQVSSGAARGVLTGATGARCRAHLAAIDGELEAARTASGQVLSQHERLSMPFELGRTLLVKAMIERQARHKSAARESLSQTLGIFEQLDAPLWAERPGGNYPRSP